MNVHVSKLLLFVNYEHTYNFTETMLLKYLSDAMPVTFDQNCFHLTFKPYQSSEFYSRK